MIAAIVLSGISLAGLACRDSQPSLYLAYNLGDDSRPLLPTRLPTRDADILSGRAQLAPLADLTQISDTAVEPATSEPADDVDVDPDVDPDPDADAVPDVDADADAPDSDVPVVDDESLVVDESEPANDSGTAPDSDDPP